MTAGGQKALYISTEENIPQPRIDGAKAALGDNRVNFEFKSCQPPRGSSGKEADEFAGLYNLLEGWMQQQRGDCMVVIDNLSPFKSISTETYAKDFYNKLDKLKTSYRQGGGRLTFLLVTHTADSRPDVKGIKGSGYLVDHAWPILMHCKCDPKKNSSTRYLVLCKVKDDRGESDETYEFDYRTEPFPHYEPRAEDVNTPVNADEDVNAAVNEDVNTPAPKKPMTAEEREKNKNEIIRLFKQETKKVKIADQLGVSRPFIDKCLKEWETEGRK